MSAPRCFIDQPLHVGETLTLDRNASNHLCAVLRLQRGAQITLFNGLGGESEAELVRSDRRRATARIVAHHPIERESPLPLILCQGVAKGERMDWVVQKATELGVHAIVPLYTEYSPPAKSSEWESKKVTHWEKIIRSACEQCGRNRLPTLYAPRRLSDYLTSQSDLPAPAPAPLTPLPWTPHAHHLWLAPEAERSFSSHLKRELARETLGGNEVQGATETTDIEDMELAREAIVIWIGPEGGFSPADSELALAAGVQPVRLGARVLRTETAGLAVLAALQTLLGDG